MSPFKSLLLRAFSPVPLASAFEPLRCTTRSKTLNRLWASSDSSHARSLLSSSRGREAVDLLPSYLADARAVQRYSRQTPQGALQLGIAESLLVEDWLVDALNHHPCQIPANAIYYQPTAGRAEFLETMAAYMEDMLGLDRGRIVPDGLVVGAGCNAVLENLCFCLAEAGNAVLIPAPYYAAFEFDLAARAGLTVVPVTTQEHQTRTSTNTSPTSTNDPAIGYYPTTAALDAAYERAVQVSGHPPRILLISHPQNPLGICYPPHVVKDCIDWCRTRSVHLISDEVYAGSVYRPEAANFKSALQLADSPGGFGPYVHWVYALSKDFALSGLRVGVAYTENEEIKMPMKKLNDLCQVSSSLSECDSIIARNVLL
jgi:aspartate/methionine/tyrosine aminotransferase